MIEIIPAIDLINGQCVRLVQGNYNAQRVYSKDPVTVARQFEQAGCNRLHLVDLDGARSGTMANLPVLEKIAAATSMYIDFSGGIRTAEACRDVINAGAAFISIGSMAVRKPALLKIWMTEIGLDKFLLGADVRNGFISIGGWLENTDVGISDFIKNYFDFGVRNFFCTDITKDGMLQGPSIQLYQEIINGFEGICLTASGGVTTIRDIQMLERIGCCGVIVGKALYEGTIKLTDLC